MDRQSYLDALKKALLDGGVSDHERVLRQFSEHFDRRLSDGCSEEDIAARLLNPVLVAKRYVCYHGPGKCPSRRSVAARVMLADVIAALLLLAALCCTAALLGLTGLLAVLSARLILQLGTPVLFEQLPYWGSLLLGVAGVGIGLLSAMGAFLLIFYGRRGIRDYFCWRRHFLLAPYCPHPPIHPLMGEKRRGRLRLAAKAAAIVSGLALIAAFVLLSAYTGYHPFWEDFGWFR